MGAASTFANDTVKLFLAGRADLHALAVISKDVEGLDVVVGFAGHDRVHAAGVVADHAAKRAAVVSCGIGREGQVMLFGLAAQTIEHHAGLHASDASLGIDFEDACHVLRKIENDGRVTALSSKRGAAAAGEKRSVMLAAESDSGEDIFFIARNHDANRDLPVVRSVGCVKGAAAGIKTDFAAKMAAKRGLKREGVQMSGWRSNFRHKSKKHYSR